MPRTKAGRSKVLAYLARRSRCKKSNWWEEITEGSRVTCDGCFVEGLTEGSCIHGYLQYVPT